MPPSIGVGGGSVHWAAWAWRFRESEFRMRSTLVERFGEQAVEGTTLVDWPITYEDLEPYYERAEYEIGVAGQAGNLNGEIQEGGNPFEPVGCINPFMQLVGTRGAGRRAGRADERGRADRC
jgi:gluconate 2-dehydrogenase alpha chain